MFTDLPRNVLLFCLEFSFITISLLLYTWIFVDKSISLWLTHFVYFTEDFNPYNECKLFILLLKFCFPFSSCLTPLFPLFSLPPISCSLFTSPSSLSYHLHYLIVTSPQFLLHSFLLSPLLSSLLESCLQYTASCLIKQDWRWWWFGSLDILRTWFSNKNSIKSWKSQRDAQQCQLRSKGPWHLWLRSAFVHILHLWASFWQKQLWK